jgi:phosphoribosylanthranilate isomerase
MRNIKLKVCGMTQPNNIEAVAALSVDYMGFIFWEHSSRFMENQIPEIASNIKKTGVFVDATIATILTTIKQHQLQAVQLHGNESPDFCASLGSIIKTDKECQPIEIIKVFSIKDTFNFEALEAYEDICDYYLFDTKGKLPGGNGYAFNWNVLEKYPSKKPFFLSGGLGLDVADEIIKFLESPATQFCYAIDINSGFEIEPGLKSIESIKLIKNKLPLA